MAEGPDLDEEVDAAMERIRESDYLTVERERAVGVIYLLAVAERCTELAGELAAEGMVRVCLCSAADSYECLTCEAARAKREPESFESA
jgi:hypothetical protein